MHTAIAFANNDVATIAWSYGKRPDDCMGFAIYRIDDKGKEPLVISLAELFADARPPVRLASVPRSLRE